MKITIHPVKNVAGSYFKERELFHRVKSSLHNIKMLAEEACAELVEA